MQWQCHAGVFCLNHSYLVALPSGMATFLISFGVLTQLCCSASFSKLPAWLGEPCTHPHTLHCQCKVGIPFLLHTCWNCNKWHCLQQVKPSALPFLQAFTAVGKFNVIGSRWEDVCRKRLSCGMMVLCLCLKRPS